MIVTPTRFPTSLKGHARANDIRFALERHREIDVLQKKVAKVSNQFKEFFYKATTLALIADQVYRF